MQLLLRPLQVFKWVFKHDKKPYRPRRFQSLEKKNRGDGWAVEDFLTYKNNPTIFVSSYGWCDL